jgi:hypothetical protein
MIFHEALHSFTGKYDDVIQKAFSLNKNAPSGVIDVFIQNHVLKYSAGLDESSIADSRYQVPLYFWRLQNKNCCAQATIVA